MALALILVLLAQQTVENRWIIFDACYIDVTATPWEMRPDPNNKRIPMFIGPDTDITLWPAPHNAVGIPCVKLATPHGSHFVVGTQEEIMDRISR